MYEEAQNRRMSYKTHSERVTEHQLEQARRQESRDAECSVCVCVGSRSGRRLTEPGTSSLGRERMLLYQWPLQPSFVH